MSSQILKALGLFLGIQGAGARFSLLLNEKHSIQKKTSSPGELQWENTRLVARNLGSPSLFSDTMKCLSSNLLIHIEHSKTWLEVLLKYYFEIR